jgi:hypothetical protein
MLSDFVLERPNAFIQRMVSCGFAVDRRRMSKIQSHSLLLRSPVQVPRIKVFDGWLKPYGAWEEISGSIKLLEKFKKSLVIILSQI